MKQKRLDRQGVKRRGAGGTRPAKNNLKPDFDVVTATRRMLALCEVPDDVPRARTTPITEVTTNTTAPYQFPPAEVKPEDGGGVSEPRPVASHSHHKSVFEVEHLSEEEWKRGRAERIRKLAEEADRLEEEYRRDQEQGEIDRKRREIEEEQHNRLVAVIEQRNAVAAEMDKRRRARERRRAVALHSFKRVASAVRSTITLVAVVGASLFVGDTVRRAGERTQELINSVRELSRNPMRRRFGVVDTTNPRRAVPPNEKLVGRKMVPSPLLNVPQPQVTPGYRPPPLKSTSSIEIQRESIVTWSRSTGKPSSKIPAPERQTEGAERRQDATLTDLMPPRAEIVEPVDRR